MKNTRGMTLVEILIVLAVIGLILSISVPAFLKNRINADGMRANEMLEQIFTAKEQLAQKLNLNPGELFAVERSDLEPYLHGVIISHRVPDGGYYALGKLIDASGEIIVPICSSEHEDQDGNGITNGEEGLFIHRPSFVVFHANNNPTKDLYRRSEKRTFADDPNGP